MSNGAAPAQGSTLSLADRYRVLARVGIGGTAVVFRCVDLHTERIVAVKVLRTAGPMIPEAAARFRREAHVAAALSHPHIVRVLDYGYTIPPPTSGKRPTWDDSEQGPVPYLAMEYVFGATLKELVRRRGPLPLDWVWRLGEQLCAALSAAHAQGVVHRDVKPQNVLILDAQLELHAKLTDFGIARQVGSDLTTLTNTGQVLGTPDYLSPEQVLGEPGGPLSDLYALGVVLFELVTARLPFEAETQLAAASRRMVADPPPLTAYRRDVPRALQEVILLALRRNPAERYADVREFAQALRWSRAQAPALAPAERGAWVMDLRGPRPPQPAPPQVPVDAAPEIRERGFELEVTRPEPLDEASESEAQSTVLRVAEHLPGVEAEPRAAPEESLPSAPVEPLPERLESGTEPDALGNLPG